MTGMSGEAASQDHSAQSQVEAAQTQARMRAEAGDLPAARTLLEHALKAGEHQLGRDHPRLASVMIDLATVAGELGNITEAQRQLRLAYGIVVTSAGPEHHSALVVEARLALATHRLGEPTDAYDRHLVDAGARVLGADHPAVLDAQDRLASEFRIRPPRSRSIFRRRTLPASSIARPAPTQRLPELRTRASPTPTDTPRARNRTSNCGPNPPYRSRTSKCGPNRRRRQTAPGPSAAAV